MGRSLPSRSADASRPNTRTSIRTRGSPPIPTSARRSSAAPVSASRAWSTTTSSTSSRSTSPTTSVAVKDAYLQYQGVKIGDTPLYFRAGNFRTPNSFELLTSELFVDTLERAAFVNAWQLDRQIGFQVSYWTDHWGLAAGIFGDRFNAANNPQPLFPGFTGDEDVTFAARATVAPINRQVNGVNQVLHFGASVRTRDIGRRSAATPIHAARCRLPSGQQHDQHGQDRRRGYLLGPRGCQPVGTLSPSKANTLISTLICRRRSHSGQSAAGRTAEHRRAIHSSVRPAYARQILNTMVGMSRVPGSSAATRTTTRKANGIGRRSTTRCAGTRARVGAGSSSSANMTCSI